MTRRASAAGGTAYVYTPNPDYSGSDSFRYTASANGVTASGTVLIQVENINDPPVISNLDNLVLQEEATHRIPFKVNDVDGPSPQVVVSAVSSDSTILPTINVTITGTGSDRYLEMTPYEGAYGLTTVTVTATDTIDTVQKSITVSFVPAWPTQRLKSTIQDRRPNRSAPPSMTITVLRDTITGPVSDRSISRCSTNRCS